MFEALLSAVLSNMGTIDGSEFSCQWNHKYCRSRKRRMRIVAALILCTQTFERYPIADAFLHSRPISSGLGSRYEAKRCINKKVPILGQISRYGSKSEESEKVQISSTKKSKRRTRDQGRRRSLNNEIFWLRKKKNGSLLAQRKLEDGIRLMQREAEKARKAFSDPDDSENASDYPDVVSFNAILSSLAKTSKRDWMAPQKAERLLRQMIDLSQDFPHLKPTIFTYNAVLEIHAQSLSNNRRRAQQTSLAILRLFREVSDDSHLEPNTFTYNLVLASNAWNSGEWRSVESWAREFLNDSSSSKIIPDRNTYNQLLRCYADAGEFEKAEVLLNRLVELSRASSGGEDVFESLKPNKVWFNLALRAIVSVRGDSINLASGQKADNVLEWMYDLALSGFGDQILPDTSVYNHVLNVHSRLGNAERAEALVREMEMGVHNGVVANDRINPDRITFSTLMKTYATQQRQSDSSPHAEEIARRAMNVFKKMVALSDAGHRKLVPNAVTYNTLISIWANVGTREALNTAMSLINQMSDDPEIGPDSITLTTMIHGWSRGVKNLARLPEAGYRAENLLQELDQLPPERIQGDFSYTKVYNSAITAWSKSGEAITAQKVDTLLSQLEGKYFNGNTNAKPDKTTFLCMIDAYAKAGIPDAEERCDALIQRMKHYKENLQFDDLEPDRVVYNAVLNALAKSCQPSAIEMAEEILTMMQVSPDERLRPDIVTYATIIDCHTKCGEGSERAEELLRFVEGTYRSGEKSLKPNFVFYSAILQAWAKTSTAEGAQKAEDLLRRNKELYDQGFDYAKPHAIMYNAVMDAMARIGDASSGRRAEELLNEMEALYQSGNEELKPSRRSYNAVILAYRNEGDSGKKAEEFLTRMEELADSGRYEVTPDVVSYNCAISAIVENSRDDDHAADRAQALLDRMKERNVTPDGRTYSPVIEAWLKRNDEKGQVLAERMLQQFFEQDKIVKEGPGRSRSMYEEEVWDVVNAYRTTNE